MAENSITLDLSTEEFSLIEVALDSESSDDTTPEDYRAKVQALLAKLRAL